MPQIHKDEIITRLKRIEDKIDQGRLSSARQWGISIGFAIMISALVMILNLPIFQDPCSGVLMILGGAVILFLSLYLKKP